MLALTGMMLVALISVLRASVVGRGKRPDEGHDRAAEREEKWSSMITSKPAINDHFKTGQRSR